MDKKIEKFLDSLNISRGDILYVASDITRLLLYSKKNKVVFDLNKLIDYFLEKIGTEGTLLFPTFNWEFCQGKTFDIKNSKSETGSLSKYALNRSDFRRSKHPIYSFAIKGRDQKYLCELDDQSGWGPKSLFAYFHENSAKNLFIGIDYKNGFTFDHYFEEKIGVDYRYFKYFEGDYIDYDGVKRKKKYKMYVRDLNKNIVTSINQKLDDVLLKKKGYERYFFNDVYFGLVNMKIAGDVMENDIIESGGLIFAKKINEL
tara:strand:- start:264 stop:1040 length:777 start_codon:yes stop_codon:yes gene_type:complete